MVDVGTKEPTRRRALASGRIEMTPEAFLSIREKQNPKGDVLAQAEIAGILGAKRVAETIPLCHPLGLDQVRVWFELDESRSLIETFCEATTTAKTGVEMEALAGVSAALLAIYDFTKAVEPALLISHIHLRRKEGGKSGVWEHPLDRVAPAQRRGTNCQAEEHEPGLHGVTVAAVTISDRVSRGESADVSGPELVRGLKALGAEIVAHDVVADEFRQISDLVQSYRKRGEIKLVVTTGGTGLSPRDVTPDAITSIADRIIPGIGELLRSEGLKKTPMAGLSRSLGAQVGDMLVITLPGSPMAVREGIEALGAVLPHALAMAAGANHEKGGHREK